MAAAKKELQQLLETQVSALSKIQKDIAKNHQVRRQYTIQHGENEMVHKRLDATLKTLEESQNSKREVVNFHLYLSGLVVLLCVWLLVLTRFLPLSKFHEVLPDAVSDIREIVSS